MTERTGAALLGLGVGVLAGAAAGMRMPMGRRSLKARAGRGLHELGDAMGKAMDDIAEGLR